VSHLDLHLFQTSILQKVVNIAVRRHGYDRKVLKAGNGVDVPKKGDTVRIEYTGYLYDESEGANDYRGVQYVMRIVSRHKVNC